MTAHFSSRVTNFEFVKNVRESGFSFKSYKESVDLSRIAHLDLDRVARELDISVLQEHVSTLVNSDLSDLKGVDPGLLKFLRLAQLCVDYCLFCQDFLEGSLSALENAHQDALKALDSLRKENSTLKERLKKENRKKKFLSEQKENIIDPYYECSQCKKAYATQEFLENHMQRRHSASEPTEDRFAKEMFAELKLEIETLRKELVKEKEEVVKNFQGQKIEMQLKREEMLWSEIEKSQAEQRARHQAEIADLTAHFQLQLKQALADLASNLSKSEIPARIPEASSHQPSINEIDIEAMKREINEMWQRKQEQQEQWFRLENMKLMEQLKMMQEKEEQRWSALKNLQSAPVASKAGGIEELPVPAARRRKTKESAPPAPVLQEEMSESSSSSSSFQEVVRPATAPAANLVVCTPKIVPARPTSALAFEEQIVEEAFSEEEDTTDRSEDIEATLQEMKNAIVENPALIESLKNEIENQIEEKMFEMGLSGAEQSLNKSKFVAVNNRMNEQRKRAEKEHRGFWKIRRGIEKKVEKKAKENVAEICAEANVKPSKLKQHSGFFAKLTKRYSTKKEAKDTSSTEIFTSTPLKEAEEPQSILKTKNLQMSSEALSAKTLEESSAELRRAQSLPASKFVSFTTDKNKESNSWDENTKSKNTAEPEVRKIGQGNFNPFLASSTSGNQMDLDDMERELGNFQQSTLDLQNKSTPLSKTDLSLPLSDDNSWDLEEI